MKLTADLISNSLSQINPLGDRELILRGKALQIKTRSITLIHQAN
jgi:hypothetical protein